MKDSKEQPNNADAAPLHPIVIWCRDMATGPMAHNPEHSETCNRLIEIADMIEHYDRFRSWLDHQAGYAAHQSESAESKTFDGFYKGKQYAFAHARYMLLNGNQYLSEN